ncbi:MAG: glycerol-3-phosphate 1-O-acyltransferase PlsY [Chloroflexia bacterium]|nr:glycerol-3-phosphate 1-O-acyltransferase PlsY [Chloroflexia bacterium]
MTVAGWLLLIAGAYLMGAVPWGLVFGKLKGIDVRQHGSGGTGATNTLRLLGRKVALAVFLLDFAKGLLPVLLARALDAPNGVTAVVAVVTVLGHCWSPYIGFTGGKGMATGGGAAVGLAWWLVLLLLPMIGIVALTRYVSLASLVATVIGPLTVILLALWDDFPWSWALAITAIAAIIVYQHRTNLARLRNGTERKFGTSEAPAPPPANPAR